MKYLKDSSGALSSVMGRIADGELSAGARSVGKLKGGGAAFSETFGNAVGEADDRAEEIVVNFCECQKGEIRERMRTSSPGEWSDDGDDGDDVEGVLEFLDSILRVAIQ